LMQPRTGSWSFDEHTTSTWVPAEVGIPSPSSGPSAELQPERDESAIWDDPEEATRQLSSQDIARTLDSATDLEMEWDEDESTTNTYNPSHARAFLQSSAPVNAAQPTAAPARSAPRPQSAVRQRAVRPEDLDIAARRADPATAGALDSLKPLTNPPQDRLRRPRTTSAIVPRAVPRPNVRAQTKPTLNRTRPPVQHAAPPRRTANPAANPAANPVPTLKPVPVRTAAAKPVPTLKPVPVRTAAAKPVPTLKPVPAARRMATTSSQPSAAPPTVPRLASRTPTLHDARVPPPPPRPTLERAPGSAPPGAFDAPAPAAPTGNERVWTQAWEEAQQLARTNLPGYVPPQQHQGNQGNKLAAPPQAQHVRRVAHQRVDGPTYRNFPPALPNAAYADVLPPTAAMHELRSARAPVAPLPFEVDDLEIAQPLAKQEIKRLALWSAIPGLALFGAVLVGRVLLSGPASTPAPTPTPAPSAEVAPAPSTPAITPEPAPVDQAPSTVAPAASERRTKPARSSSKTRATRDDDSSDIAASAPRATRTHDDSSDIAASAPRATRTREVFDTEPAARASKLDKVEKSEAAPAAAPVEPTSGIGILRLNSRPWSQVFVDGKLVGNTPQMGLRLRAGKHQIELVNPQLSMSKKFQVEVQADEIVTRAELLEE
jgi:hypothetical protein